MEYARLDSILFQKYQGNRWLDEIFGYMLDRYLPTESRLVDSFRYVMCHKRNRESFSYEYASIIRDAGSNFGSAMDKLLEKTNTSKNKTEYDISDYKKWLIGNIPNIHSISLEINLILSEKYLVPFSILGKSVDAKIPWWDAYTKLKHSEIDNFIEGNQENAVSAVGSLAAILSLFNSSLNLRLFANPGFRNPASELEQLLFSN